MKPTLPQRARALLKKDPAKTPSLPTRTVQKLIRELTEIHPTPAKRTTETGLSKAKLQKQTESELKRHKDRLEVLVQERTAELSSVNAGLRAANETLNRFNRAAVHRELRMVQLKKQVNALSAELGRPPPYAVFFEKGARGRVEELE